MFRRAALMAILAAGALALGACQGRDQKAAEAPAQPAATAAQSQTPAATPVADAGGAVSCGGFVGDDVCRSRDAKTYCQKTQTDGSQCEAQTPGTCAPRPDMCSKERVPVCGCDGKTYGNACEASQAGVNVRAQGECKPG